MTMSASAAITYQLGPSFAVDSKAMFKTFALILLALGPSLSGAAFYCANEFATESFYDVNFWQPLPSEVNEAIHKVGIGRTDLFTDEEKKWAVKDKPFAFKVGRAKIEKNPESGSLYDPQKRGVVVVPASPNVTDKKSETLLNELVVNGSGDSGFFTGDSFDKKMKKEKILNASDIEDIILNQFLDELNKKTNISTESLEYVRAVFTEMIESAHVISHSRTEKTKKLMGIRIRWKRQGSGADIDRLHTDSMAFATSLAVVGFGPEFFYINDEGIEARSTGTKQITHMSGHYSRNPLLHRASTFSGERVVFLLFWK